MNNAAYYNIIKGSPRRRPPQRGEIKLVCLGKFHVVLLFKLNDLCVYTYVCVYMYVYIYIYVYWYRERDVVVVHIYIYIYTYIHILGEIIVVNYPYEQCSTRWCHKGSSRRRTPQSTISSRFCSTTRSPISSPSVRGRARLSWPHELGPKEKGSSSPSPLSHEVLVITLRRSLCIIIHY